MSVGQARATLTRAATFWAAETDRLPAWHEPAGDIRARYTANCLRELDGFLRTLLDELAPEPDRRQRNTANKLNALSLAMGHGVADAVRLRAIGRSAGCLLHCGGWVRRPDAAAGGWMTAGWPHAEGDTLRRYAIGERLRPSPSDVADMCGFFLRVGAALA